MRPPEFIYEERNAIEIYEHWLSIIHRLEDSTITTDSDNTDLATYNSLTLGYTLFPLLDSISFTLYGSGMRRYLRELGYSSDDANLITKMFRNGILHNVKAHRLNYNNAELSWSLMFSNGSGGFHQYDPGYVDPDYPEDSLPREEILSIFQEGENRYTAMLHLDRLAAHIKYDLLQRKAENNPQTLRLIVGEIISETFSPNN